MTFIEKLLDDLLEKHGTKISDLVIVFPNRRAGLFFQKYFQQNPKIKRPVFLPEIFAISDFITYLSDLNPIDPLELVFELYQVYQQVFAKQAKPFAQFYSFGKMILSDFEEIDKHLADPARIFQALKEFQTIEASDLEDHPSKYKDEFLKYWVKLGCIYEKLQTNLLDSKKAYLGLIFRDVAEHCAQYQAAKTQQWPKIIFAGFNALTKAEVQIFQYFCKQGQAEIYWDMDKYFVDDPNQEAGFFFRKYQKQFAPYTSEIKWVDDVLSTSSKKIRIIETTQKIAQVKIFGDQLDQILTPKTKADKETFLENSAVILADEKLVFPLLYSLPSQIPSVNVTMGYSLQSTPLYGLLTAILDMHINRQRLKLKQKYYYQDVLAVLQHLYIQHIDHEYINLLVANIKKYRQIYVPLKTLGQDSDFLKKLFALPETTSDFLDLFEYLFIEIKNSMPSQTQKKDLNLEIIYHFYTLIRRLKDLISHYQIQLNHGIFAQLLKEILAGFTLPFSGEPLKGFQVMGFLEARVLDFEHLFILSANEGFLPNPKPPHSFIPYEIKKSCDLPTIHEFSALYAYNFYRLLKRASEVTIFYCNKLSDQASTEKSRFLEQLLIEYQTKNPRVEIIQEKITLSIHKPQTKPIVIAKDSAVLQRLQQKTYSPSSLARYLTCPLKFYFQDILKTEKPLAVQEELEPAAFGNIMHQVLRKLYEPYLNQKNTDVDWEKMLSRAIHSAYLAEIKNLPAEYLHKGKNLLNIETIKILLNKFFKFESRQEVLLKNLEKAYHTTISVPGFAFSLNFKGTIDRIDQYALGSQEVTRIIDYKTGNISSLALKDLADLSKGPRFLREAFQLLCYFYLYWQNTPATPRVNLCIYSFAEGSKGYQSLRLAKETSLSAAHIPLFEAYLHEIFKELFNSKIPFKQTDVLSHCQYCDFRTMCGVLPL
ncbi:hypothetical protein HN511_07230 [bacterium]|nr:hypothetical protein [bacterium]